MRYDPPMPSLVPAVDVSELAAWPTKRLLALRTRLLRCEESLENSDVQDPTELDPDVIRFKSDPRWTALYQAVLDLLATREHQPSGTERTEARKARASAARTSKERRRG